MSKRNTTSTLLKVLGIGVALVQIFDVIIHAATDQLEPLRVSSNVIILVWLAIVTSGRFSSKFLSMAVSSIGLYLILNIVFLAREGLTNIEQGGELRTMLFLLIILTTALSTSLTYILGRHKSN